MICQETSHRTLLALVLQIEQIRFENRIFPWRNAYKQVIQGHIPFRRRERESPVCGPGILPKWVYQSAPCDQLVVEKCRTGEIEIAANDKIVLSGQSFNKVDELPDL